MTSTGKMKRCDSQGHDLQLRRAAEQKLRAAATEGFTRDELAGPRPLEELVHELQVHQIELEMQNQTLREAQIALEESRDRYVDFYDFAPVGYLTITDKGLIAEINLAGAAMLGLDRATLLHRRLSQSVATADRDGWHQHLAGALRQDAKQDCELALLRPDGSRLDVRIDSQRLEKEGRAPVLRVVLTDITARKRAEQRLVEMAAGLEEQVSERTRQLRALAAQLTLTEERERRWLAEELHDDLGQVLAAARIRLAALAAGPLRSPVEEIVALVVQAEQSARTITMKLSPPILQTLGFVPALEWLAEDMQRRYGLTVHVDARHGPRPMVAEIQAMLYRSVRELLVNVAKHAGVGDASLYCHCDGCQLVLAVSDSGRGFDQAASSGGATNGASFGLRSIYERVTNIGGEMEIDSSPGNGATILLRVPCSLVAREDTA